MLTKYRKTVLLPIEVANGDFCFGKETICDHFDCEGGCPSCDYKLGTLEFDTNGAVEKASACKSLKDGGNIKQTMEKYTSGTGQHLKVHNRSKCAGEFCSIHNPSNHKMKDWPTHWRDDRGLMERICKCGVGHPDPDDLAFKKRQGLSDYEGVHGCCGCCKEEKGDTNDLANGSKKDI